MSAKLPRRRSQERCHARKARTERGEARRRLGQRVREQLLDEEAARGIQPSPKPPPRRPARPPSLEARAPSEQAAVVVVLPDAMCQDLSAKGIRGESGEAAQTRDVESPERPRDRDRAEEALDGIVEPARAAAPASSATRAAACVDRRRFGSKARRPRRVSTRRASSANAIAAPPDDVALAHDPPERAGRLRPRVSAATISSRVTSAALERAERDVRCLAAEKAAGDWAIASRRNPATSLLNQKRSRKRSGRVTHARPLEPEPQREVLPECCEIGIMTGVTGRRAARRRAHAGAGRRCAAAQARPAARAWRDRTARPRVPASPHRQGTA